MVTPIQVHAYEPGKARLRKALVVESFLSGRIEPMTQPIEPIRTFGSQSRDFFGGNGIYVGIFWLVQEDSSRISKQFRLYAKAYFDRRYHRHINNQKAFSMGHMIREPSY